MNGHSDVVGAEEDGTISFNEDTHCYEEVNKEDQTQFVFDDDKGKVVHKGEVNEKI